jgi:trehalose monomycolate/heme transporter
MAGSLSSRLYAWRKWLVGLWLGFSVAGLLIGSPVFSVLEPGGFEVVGSRSQALELEARRRFGVATPSLVALYDAHGRTLDDPAIREQVAHIVEQLQVDPLVAEVGSPLEIPEALVARDPSRWLITVDLRGEHREQEEAYDRLDGILRSGTFETAVGGELAAMVDAQQIARNDLIRAELIAVPAVAILLVVFFRSVTAALLPLVLGGFSIAMSIAVLRVLGEYLSISLFAVNIVTFLGFGLAVDYALFMVQRYREELGAGHEPATAVVRTTRTAGKTILYAGLAVSASLLSLLWVPILLLRSVAVAGVFVVLLTNFAAVILLPAMLGLLGDRIGAVQPPAEREETRSARFWRASSRRFMRRPWLVAALVAGALIALGTPALRMQTALADARTFEAGSDVRRVYEAVADRQLFPFADVGAHLLLVRTRGGESIRSPQAARALVDLDRAIRDVPGVESVTGVAASFASGRSAAAVLGNLEMLPAPVRRRIDVLIDGDATLVRVASIHPPDSPEGRRQVEQLRTLHVDPLVLDVTGDAARSAEVWEAMSGNLLRVVATVAIATFVMLLVGFGAPVVAAKAVLMTALSLTASFGALVWIFQDGRFERLLGYESVGTIDPTVPVMIFAVVFGLSMDYELFLISRIKEHHDHGKDNRESVADGLAASGPVITKAAILLLAVIAGLIAGSLAILKELGVGMALAIIIDASLIRILLVPSTMALLKEWNWWAPSALRRFWHRSRIGVSEAAN